MIFYPEVNTPVCASEILAYTEKIESFEKRECSLMFSSDAELSEHILFAEKHKRPDLTGYQALQDGSLSYYPYYIQDEFFEFLTALGGLVELDDSGNWQPQRVTLIIDENLIIRYLEINPFLVGRNPNEHIRILDALQTGELCGACREEGENTLGAYQP